MGDFERDTRVEGEAGRYTGHLSQDWEIWGPNGGYLAAIALRAAGREAKIPRPASFSAHFLAVGGFDAIEIDVTPVRRGRSSESLRASVRQGERVLLESIVRTAAPSDGTLEHRWGEAPEVRDPAELETIAEIVERLPPQPEERSPFPFWDNLECRPTDPARIEEPPRPRPPVALDWYRFRPRHTFDDPWVDAGRSLLLVDTMSWPAACRPHPRDSGFIAPNLDVNVVFHDAAPESAFLLSEHECRVATGGLMGTTGRVWSEDRRLLASGTAQLYCIPSRA